MATTDIVEGQSGLTVRTAINSNFKMLNSMAFTKPNTVILFGDSITIANGDGPGVLDPLDANTVSARGYWNWANAYAGQRFSLVRNAGGSGETTSDLLARIDSDVLAYPSEWVILQGATNDIAQGRTFAQITADLTAILDKIQEAGRSCLLFTVTPATSFDTTAEQMVRAQYNRWVIDLPLTRPGLVVQDVWSLLANLETGLPGTGTALDGVHLSANGAQIVGRALALTLDTVAPRRPYRIMSTVDDVNICGNPNFASNGSGWSTLGTGVTPVFSAMSNRFSNKAVLTYSGVTSTNGYGISYEENISGGRFSAGDVIQASARFTWSGGVAITSATGLFFPFMRIQQRKIDNSFGAQTTCMFIASSEAVQPIGSQIEEGDVVMLTYRITLEENVNRLYLALGWNGMADGVVEISDFSVWKE